MNNKTSIRRRIALWLIAVTALALTTTNTFAAPAKTSRQNKPTVVLVHRAFADAFFETQEPEQPRRGPHLRFGDKALPATSGSINPVIWQPTTQHCC